MDIKSQQELQTSIAWEKEIILKGYSDSMPMCCTQFEPIGGDMGTENADFEVSEIPAYLPSGQGEHIYLYIEKMGKTTQDATRAIERAFGVKEIDVGCAGKKDAHAITRQYISIRMPKDNAEALETLKSLDWLKILSVSRHANKLRTGHLRGNRFKVRLYGVCADDDAIRNACKSIEENGFINYFGKQRFGFDGSNVEQGLRILNGEKARHQTKKFVISALQSALFNLLAARRFHKEGFRVHAGDVLQKINAGCFVCDDPEIDSARAAMREVVVTLPLPGKKIITGAGDILAYEQKTYEEFVQTWAQDHPDYLNLNLNTLANHADGARRPLWIHPENVSFERQANNSVCVEFSLPSGCYATVFLRHLCGSSFTR